VLGAIHRIDVDAIILVCAEDQAVGRYRRNPDGRVIRRITCSSNAIRLERRFNLNRWQSLVAGRQDAGSGFDVDDMYLRARIASLYSDGEQEFGYRGSINFANNFMGNRLGIAGSLSHQERVFGSESYEVDGGWGLDESVPFPNEVEMRNYQVTRERTTAALNFDYRVNGNLSLYSRSTWSDFSDHEYRSRVEVKLEDGEYDDVNSSGNIAVFTADELEIDRDIKDRLETQMIFATDFGGEWLNGNTSVDWSLSYVYAEEAEPNRLDVDFRYEFEDGEIFGVDSTNPLLPELIFAGGVTTDRVFDPSIYENNGIEITNGLSQDREYAAAFNVRHDMDFGTMPGFIQYGLRARTRDKKYALDFDVYDDANLLLSDVDRTVDYGQGPIGPVADPAQVRDFVFSNLSSLDFESVDSDIDSFGASYRAEEDIFAGYLMGSVENGPLRLAGGVRIEQTDMAARGYETFLAEEDATVNGVVLTEDTVFVTPTSASDDYTDVLPSILARYELTDNVIVRGAYFASIQRPNPGQFAPRILVEQNDDDEVEGEFGNPDLERLEADNFDVSIEWYPNNDAVVYLGYFRKDLDNVIAGVGYQAITLNGRFFDEAASFINLPEAEVSGIEFNYQQALDFLPVEGFIAGFNVTATDSEATLADGRVIPLPRQSDTVWNAVLGYDNAGWDLRAVVSSRSEYLDEVRGGADEDRWVLEHTQLDLSAKYSFNDRLQIFGDLKNVTDEPYRAVTRPDGIDRVEQLEEYGWSAVFGVRVTY